MTDEEKLEQLQDEIYNLEESLSRYKRALRNALEMIECSQASRLGGFPWKDSKHFDLEL